MIDTLTHCPRCATGKLLREGDAIVCVCCGHSPKHFEPLPLVNDSWSSARRLADEARKRSA